MKRLLLLTSNMLFMFLCHCCSNKQLDSKIYNGVDSNVRDSSIKVKDSIIQSPFDKTQINDSDSIEKHEAPKHYAPDQAKIDSIKKAKLKQKKRF